MLHEEGEALEAFAEQARKVSQMVQTPGWVEVVRPTIEHTLEALMESLVLETEHTAIIRIQQSIQAYREILSCVEQVLVDGDAARQEHRRRAGLSEHPA